MTRRKQPTFSYTGGVVLTVRTDPPFTVSPGDTVRPVNAAQRDAMTARTDFEEKTDG